MSKTTAANKQAFTQPLEEKILSPLSDEWYTDGHAGTRSMILKLEGFDRTLNLTKFEPQVI